MYGSNIHDLMHFTFYSCTYVYSVIYEASDTNSSNQLSIKQKVHIQANTLVCTKSSIKRKYILATRERLCINWKTHVMKETGCTCSCFVDFFHPPKTHLPIEKMLYQWIGLLFNIKTEMLFCWFLLPSFGNHECAYACVPLSFVWK